MTQYTVGQRVRVHPDAAEAMDLPVGHEGTVKKVYRGEHANKYPFAHQFLTDHPVSVAWDDEDYTSPWYTNIVTGEQEYDWHTLSEVERAE
jgi:hypothetical protein